MKLKYFSSDFIQTRIDIKLMDGVKFTNDFLRNPINRPQIDYHDFSSYAGIELINRVYLALVGRKPDKKGMKTNLDYLNRGYPKSTIIYLVSRRPESKTYQRSHHIRIQKRYRLIIKYYLYRLIEPWLKIYNLKGVVEKIRYNYRYGKYFK